MSQRFGRIRSAPRLSLATLAAAWLAGACHDSGGGSPPSGTPTVANVMFDDGTHFDVVGAKVFVDDVLVGHTGAGGMLPIEVPDDGYVRVLVGTSMQGELQMEGAVPSAVLIPVRGDIERHASVRVAQASGGVLDSSSGALTLRVLGRKDRPVQLAPDPIVLLRDRFNGDEFDVSSSFQVASAGRLLCQDPAVVLAQAASLVNEADFTVRGEDLDGATFDATASVLVGQHEVQFTLAAPPSFPGLPVGGVQIGLARIGSDFTRAAVSNGAGRLTLGSLPNGTYELAGQIEAAGQFYTASGALFVNRDLSVTVNLLGVSDSAGGVPPYVITSTASAASVVSDLDRLELEAQNRRGANAGSLQEGSGTISVAAGAQDQVVTESGGYAIPQGTQKAQLEYEVWTDEYPSYVFSQSEYNDNWTVKVLSPSGSPLYSIARNVNQQLFVEPLWNGLGATGLIVRDIDVAALTQTGAAQLTLVITATNIGDSLLPTFVSARIVPSSLRISEVVGDTLTRVENCGAHTKAMNNQLAVSIPFAGDVNVQQRVLTARLAGRSADASITNVRVELINVDTGTSMATLYDAAPDDDFVRHVATGQDRVLIRVTNTAARPSQVGGSSPPPAQEVRYRITVEATAPGSSPQSAEKDSADFLALWRMPDIFTRTGCRDTGLDDWCSRAASIWLEQNSGLVANINDISGEHARNTGHATHGHGSDIDMRQFPSGTFPTTSGGDIYTHLATRVQQAISGNPAALAEVNGWVLSQRSGIEPLISLASVSQVLVGIGGTMPGNPAPDGWLRRLLLDGQFTYAGGTFSIAAGAWAHAEIAKVIPAAGHNDHHHITLDVN